MRSRLGDIAAAHEQAKREEAARRSIQHADETVRREIARRHLLEVVLAPIAHELADFSSPSFTLVVKEGTVGAVEPAVIVTMQRRDLPSYPRGGPESVLAFARPPKRIDVLRLVRGSKWHPQDDSEFPRRPEPHSAISDESFTTEKLLNQLESFVQDVLQAG